MKITPLVKHTIVKKKRTKFVRINSDQFKRMGVSLTPLTLCDM